MRNNKALSIEQVEQLAKDYATHTTLELQHKYQISNFSVLGYAYRNGWKKHPSLTRELSNQRNEVLKASLGMNEKRLLKGEGKQEPWRAISTGNLVKRIGNVTLHKGV